MNLKNVSASLGVKLLIFLFVTGLVITGLYFHEPWFDEAQSWLIGRDASMYDILFVLPHYEGHPPLWHIILKAVSLMGLSYEVSIKLVQFLFFELSLILIVFIAPFKNSIKILITGSYFFLYQYSVIARPYAMMMTAAFICAMLYKSREKRPFLYILSLMFLCLCHSYGIAMAGGIVLADLIETTVTAGDRSLQKIFLNNKRKITAYLILFVFAICLVMEIMPARDAFAVNMDKKIGFVPSFLLSWLLIPADATVTSISSDLFAMQNRKYDPFELAAAAVISLVIWLVLYIFSKNRKKRLNVFIPYLFISVLMAVYAYSHHFGVFCIYIVYALWILADEEPLKISEITAFLHISSINKKTEKLAFLSLYAFIFITNMGWNLYSYATDILNPYDPSRALAEWITDNNFENKSFLAAWAKANKSHAIFSLNAYFDDGIAYNTNQNKTYLAHTVASAEEYEKNVEEWKKHSKPDFIMLNDKPLVEICDELEIENDYLLIYSDYGIRIFKNKPSIATVYLYASKEIYNTTEVHFDPYVSME